MKIWRAISNIIPFIGTGVAILFLKKMEGVGAKLPHLPMKLTPALRF
jgi:uncharacterized membrane protein YbhN (UPF0104 family)